MRQTSCHTCVKYHAIAVLVAVSYWALQPAVAADNAIEHEQLVTLVRQLDMLDRQAEYTATLPRQDDFRYHFGYTRLREDIERIRSGIQDYLTPQRAQPRDPVELSGNYRQESEEAP